MDWYTDLYASNASAENPFGSELLAERRSGNHLSSNAAALARIQAYGFSATFPRPQHRTPAETIELFDRALGLS